MLSYQHGYHAGNHADVLKHIVLLAIIRHMQEKDAPISLIDTHAGAGAYALDHAQATTTGEFETGIGKLQALYAGNAALPALLLDYLDTVARFNMAGQWRTYPGSPLMMLANVRNAQGIADTLRVFERHPAERLLLEAHLIRHTPASTGRSRVRPALIQGSEGFAGLATLLPPTSRRALVLIDPSYEIKTDYRSVLETLRTAMQKFPTGTYAVWYPMLKRIEAQQLVPRLKTLCGQHKGVEYLHTSLAISASQPDGFGLWGSGVFVINPPWKLAAQLKETLPTVKTALATSKDARWVVEQG
jgi:23S rRNA (adenine2030-N6)-methyltransferase